MHDRVGSPSLGRPRGEGRRPRFRRQVPCGHWIADFCCFNPKLVIEIDDTSHEFRDETLRTKCFEAQGFPVLRFTNKQVAQEFPEVMGTIAAWVAHLKISGPPPE